MGMKKQWTGREKLALVLEGLKGECRISELSMSMESRRGCTANGGTNCLRMEPNYLNGAEWIMPVND